MASRIITNGRVTLSTGRWRYPEQAPPQGLDEFVFHDRLLARTPSKLDDVWEDDKGLKHRIVDNLPNTDEWQTLAVIADWFGVTEKDARAWAMTNHLDCAVQRGSVVGLYRILSVKQLRDLSAKLRKEKAAKR